MSLPTAVFLDTSILDAQQYNFASTAVSTFVATCQKRNVTLLVLPDPTEREIRRHIAERSDEALQALKKARTQAPFLAKWKGFPAEPSPDSTKWEGEFVAEMEWKAFLTKFTVTRLGYDGLDMRQVMRWYDQQEAPFSSAKRKEFPDAISIALLDVYAQKQSSYVAVISADRDFERACARYTSPVG
jgi:hypothetical protein